MPCSPLNIGLSLLSHYLCGGVFGIGDRAEPDTYAAITSSLAFHGSASATICPVVIIRNRSQTDHHAVADVNPSAAKLGRLPNVHFCA